MCPASRRAAAATVPSPPAATTSSVVVDQFSERRFSIEYAHELVARCFDELANPGERCAVAGFLIVEE